MHIHSLEQWRHDHNFNIDTSEGERRTRLVVWLTAAMMVVEVAAGYLFGSMALLADGWHMGTHVAALAISLFAYRYARLNADNPRFSFGTGKVTALGGFASAITLAMVALLMGAESIERLLAPETIRFNQAILVAVVGLLVNLLSAWLLHGGSADPHHHHDHHPDHHAHHPGHHHHHDQNLRAAYLHVIADALTSVLAIIALIAGKYFGWIWMDAMMGIVGAILITRWSIGLLKETSSVLLDSVPSEKIGRQITEAIEGESDNRIVDLHIWQLGPKSFGVIVSLVTHHPKEPDHYKALIQHIRSLGHVTIEVTGCEGDSCAMPPRQ
ncbi:CDF family Co(II)/Ni(II) efflux transporter DmeF [Sedimenticola sp.]|uniref:CDF family Co(II)/Ni(II) efflux transporter DmeF n=1 Tax=Sedimenticola sp. TaxID=1940285 RepID=UPI003D1436A3